VKSAGQWQKKKAIVQQPECIFNLISNVIRYGSDGKYLGIFIRTDKKSVYIDMVDKGQGIDKSFSESVFDRLFTLEDSRSRNIQGNGLGLTITKNLAMQPGEKRAYVIPYHERNL